MLSLNRCFFVVLGANAAAFVLVYMLVLTGPSAPDGILMVDQELCRPSSTNDISFKLILFWTTYYERADFYLGYGHEAFTSRGCAVNACETTSNRSRLSEADAVVFHIRDLDPSDLPVVRHTCQRWILFLMETPYYTQLDLTSYRDFFNWTFTYRLDSDIPPRISVMSKSDADNVSSVINHAEGKTRLAVWLVSHCSTFSHRERYVDELRKYVPVDVYGACDFSNMDDDDREVCARDTPLRQCYRTFEKRYKFYLSFENSLCQDYFSEKLYNIYEHDMVPVVLGKVDYAKFAPPHSLIDASDFATPADLADYLRRVDEDDGAYNAYFKWKRNWTFSIDTSPWCDVCAKLNDPSEPPKSYADIEAWWVGGGNCTNDYVGRWKIASFYDTILDSAAVRFHMLKHRTKIYLHNLKSDKT